LEPGLVAPSSSLLPPPSFLMGALLRDD
jgi:hypothetical protein